MSEPHKKNFPPLVLPEDQPSLPGIHIPRDLYWVLKEPAPLGGMPYPSLPARWEQLYAAGFQHVVNLTHDHFPYDPQPLNGLIAVRLDDLICGQSPAHPEREAANVRLAVNAALRKLSHNEGVIVHCAGGTGRTGTVLGCILRSLGFPAGQVIPYLNRLNRARYKDGWPESPWQAALVEAYLP